MQNTKPSISIVVPCFNEAGNIPAIIKSFKEVVSQEPKAEILLVNNGSNDDSADVFARELENCNDNFRLINLSKNQGYGYGILAGLKEANANILAWTHADQQTDPLDVLRALKLFRSEPENDLLTVKGHRCKRKLSEAFFSFAMQIISSLALRTPLSEINAQPKLFSKTFFKDFVEDEAPWDFSLDLFLLYKAKKHGYIKSIPVFFKKRIHGEAKGGGSFRTKIKLIDRTLKYIFKLRSELTKT